MTVLYSMLRRKNTSSSNLHRNCQVFVITFEYIFNTICIPYILRKFISDEIKIIIRDTPTLDDTPLCEGVAKLRDAVCGMRGD